MYEIEDKTLLEDDFGWDMQYDDPTSNESSYIRPLRGESLGKVDEVLPESNPMGEEDLGTFHEPVDVPDERISFICGNISRRYTLSILKTVNSE